MKLFNIDNKNAPHDPKNIRTILKLVPTLLGVPRWPLLILKQCRSISNLEMPFIKSQFEL
jgi:hypothetical protein